MLNSCRSSLNKMDSTMRYDQSPAYAGDFLNQYFKRFVFFLDEI